LLLGIYKISTMFNISKKQFKVNYIWITTGIKISSIFLLSTFMLKIIEFSDRYMIKYILNHESLGIYTFYVSFSNVAQVIVFTVVVMTFLPSILDSNKINYINLKNKFNKHIIIVSIISFFVVILALYTALFIVSKNLLYENIIVFYILNFAILIQNISLIYYYTLYKRKKEKIILISTIVAAIINVICNFIFIPHFGLIGAALSTIIAIFTMSVFQYFFIRKLKND